MFWCSIQLIGHLLMASASTSKHLFENRDGRICTAFRGSRRCRWLYTRLRRQKVLPRCFRSQVGDGVSIGVDVGARAGAGSGHVEVKGINLELGT